MTVLKGKDLIIMADGVALAAAKSCDIEVNCEAIPVSSPTSGDWEDSIPGRKSWKVTTNHLVMSAASMLLKASQIVTLRMKVADGDALSFDGYVNNVTITQQSYTPTSSSKIYWDSTRKKFVISNGAALNTKYYLSWSGGYDYMNPEMRLFSYNGDYLTVANGELINEILQGSAFCKTAKVTASEGNLSQGSFVWIGKGALATTT